jgi:hydroxypyruvate reductase
MAPGQVPAKIDKTDPRTLLLALFDAAVKAALPSVIVPSHLPKPPKGRTIVIGGGKASAAMAKAVEDHWQGPIEGLVVTRYGHGVACKNIEIVEASHPVPDAAGEAAARRILEKVQGLTKDDLVIAVISGGGSALMALPAEGLTLADKQTLNKALLASGASIDEMNCVRKHLSAIKGGRLAAAAHPARVVSLLISDVPGDDPSVIASGPTVPDKTTFADALAIVRKYKITEPRSAIAYLEKGGEESVKPGDTRLEGNALELVATPQLSLEAAAEVARKAGITPVILGDAIEGESREVARVMAGIARQVKKYGQPAAAPCVLLSGGETTVTVRGKGRGGRSAEFLLALAVALDGLKGVHALSADTDGIDGSEDNAGAIALDDILARADKAGVSAKAALADNDGYTFFQKLDSLVVTGPTLTNVNDFRAILIV